MSSTSSSTSTHNQGLTNNKVVLRRCEWPEITAIPGVVDLSVPFESMLGSFPAGTRVGVLTLYGSLNPVTRGHMLMLTETRKLLLGGAGGGGDGGIASSLALPLSSYFQQEEVEDEHQKDSSNANQSEQGADARNKPKPSSSSTTTTTTTTTTSSSPLCGFNPVNACDFVLGLIAVNSDDYLNAKYASLLDMQKSSSSSSSPITTTTLPLPSPSSPFTTNCVVIPAVERENLISASVAEIPGASDWIRVLGHDDDNDDDKRKSSKSSSSSSFKYPYASKRYSYGEETFDALAKKYKHLHLMRFEVAGSDVVIGGRKWMKATEKDRVIALLRSPDPSDTETMELAAMIKQSCKEQQMKVRTITITTTTTNEDDDDKTLTISSSPSRIFPFFIMGPGLPSFSSTSAREALQRGEKEKAKSILHDSVVEWLIAHGYYWNGPERRKT